MKRILHKLIILLLLVIDTSCELTFKEEPGADPVSLFEDLWNTFNESYAPFQQRDIDWEEQYNLYRPKVESFMTDEKLFEIIGEMLSSLDDGHVSLVAPGREVFFSNTVRREKLFEELFNLSVIRENYLNDGYRSGEADAYCYGKIRKENIGYIFFDHIGENMFKIEDFLNEYIDAEGYIVDLRHNTGGDFTYCLASMGRLTDMERRVFRSKTKNGPGMNDFTGWSDWYIQPVGEYVDKPIAVLTDRYTISAGERSVMAFMSLPNISVIGDTTNGAHGTMIGRELANGWYYTLVPQLVEISEGISYEGIGLPPDLFVRNTVEDMDAGVDSTLVKAIAWIHSQSK